MNDRELLELAAKAVGGTLSEGWGKRRTGPTWDTWEWYGPKGITRNGITEHPLEEDRHAFRLAVELRINVELTARTVLAQQAGTPYGEAILDLLGDDPYAATRRAIVRAAAEIGKAMP